MIVLALQPAYPRPGTVAAAEQCLAWMRARLDELEPGAQDLVLLPEYATSPGLEDGDPIRSFARGPGGDFLRVVAAAAARLACTTALSAPVQDGPHWFNRTLVFDRAGQLAHTYDKVHLTEVESRGLGLTPGPVAPVVEHDGLRLGFATCFDFYFAEHFEALAAQAPDLLLCPSYQRSESADRIRLLSRARALDSGAYLLRSSYAMGSEDRGGRSLVAGPDGELLAEVDGEPGVLRAEIDPHRKFVKPASHGQDPIEHRALIEAHRQPGTYRAAGEAAASRQPGPR